MAMTPNQGNFFGTAAPSAAVGARDFGGTAPLAAVLFHSWMTGAGATLGQVLTFSASGVVWSNSTPLPPASGGPYVIFGGAWTPMPNVCTPPAGTPTGYVMVASTGTPGYVWVDPVTIATPNPLLPPAGTPSGSMLTYNANASPAYQWAVPSPTTQNVPTPPSTGGPFALNVTGGNPTWVTIPSQVTGLPLVPTSGGPFVLDISTGTPQWLAQTSTPGAVSNVPNAPVTGGPYVLNSSSGTPTWVTQSTTALASSKMLAGGFGVTTYTAGAPSGPRFFALVSNGYYVTDFHASPMNATTSAVPNGTTSTSANIPGVQSWVNVLLPELSGSMVPVSFPSTAAPGSPTDGTIVQSLL